MNASDLPAPVRSTCSTDELKCHEYKSLLFGQRPIAKLEKSLRTTTTIKYRLVGVIPRDNTPTKQACRRPNLRKRGGARHKIRHQRRRSQQQPADTFFREQ